MPRLKIVFEMVNSHSGQFEGFELYREEPVIYREAQIVIVQFHKRRLEIFCLSKVCGKSISLELKASAQHRHEEADNSRVGSCDVLQDDHQPNQGWLGVREAECLIEGTRFAEIAEQSKHREDLNLCNEYILENMVHTPVTKFVAKNCDNLLVVTTSLFLLLLLLLSASRLFLLFFSFLF